MFKPTPILILLIFATRGILSQGEGGLIGGGNMSISPFNPIGFTRFILYMISLPFRIIGKIFGLPFELGSELSDSNDGIFGIFLEIPRGIARFIEEIFHFIRIFLDRIFGNLEGGAAYIAGDGTTSQSYRNNRNNNSSTSVPN